MSLPPPIIPGRDVSLIDAAAQRMGQDLGELMSRAAAALAHEASAMAPHGTILIACGGGNNGGDGWLCARDLAQAGHPVQVWPVVTPKSELCRWAASRAELVSGIEIIDRVPTTAPALIIDAMLGAGTDGAPPREPIGSAVRSLTELASPILAADMPTGLGSPLMLEATRCVCFQLAKAELLEDSRVREFKTVDIGILPAAWQEVQPECFAAFPRHRYDAHKGQHGELLVVGGGSFPGALELACRSALRSGCDLVRAWTSDGPPLPPTVIAHRQQGRHLAPSDPELLTAVLVRADAVLIGPGLGREPGAPEVAQQALSLALEMGVPAIIDADGITATAHEVRQLNADSTPVVLTPHAMEARSLLGAAPTPERIHQFATPGRCVLAKGPVDLISDGRRWQTNARGNPRLAVGGSGDCLAGLVAGLVARGAQGFDAARMAVLWLTETADRLWIENGPCYDPLDIISGLPETLHATLEGLGMWPPVDRK